MDFEGSKFNINLDITEIAKKIRRDIITVKESGDILFECNPISVVSSRSGNGKITINVKDSTLEILDIYDNFTDDAKAVSETLYIIGMDYNCVTCGQYFFELVVRFDDKLLEENKMDVCQKCGMFLPKDETEICSVKNLPDKNEEFRCDSDWNIVQKLEKELKARGYNLADLLTPEEFDAEAEKRGYVKTDTLTDYESGGYAELIACPENENPRTCPVRTVPSGLWETLPQCSGIEVLTEGLNREPAKLAVIAGNGGYIETVSGVMKKEELRAIESLIAWRITAVEGELAKAGFEGDFNCMRRGSDVIRTVFSEQGANIIGYSMNGMWDDFAENTAQFAQRVIRGNNSRACTGRTGVSGKIPTEKLIEMLKKRIPNLAELVSEEDFDKAAKERGYVRTCRVCGQPEDEDGLCADCLEVFRVDCGYDCRSRGYVPQLEYEAMYA